ncbi:conserved protein of unknown function [Pseudomonas marincola]|uniref:Uncharacterized protein n=1 Tax=Pseudomonas marincola TaxID=437900 RepID=A0A653E459_9PSED|nr:conserved protein of unknown function [Pseudomonas marincola]
MYKDLWRDSFELGSILPKFQVYAALSGLNSLHSPLSLFVHGFFMYRFCIVCCRRLQLR